MVTFQPSASYQEALDRASALWRITADYWDVFGRQHVTSTEVKTAILASLGVPAATREELDIAIEERLWHGWSRLTPPTLVTGPDVSSLEISVPQEQAGGAITLEIHWEEGGGEMLDCARATVAGEARLRGRTFLRKQVPIEAALPPGYHRLIAKAGAARAETQWIVGPDRTWMPPALSNGGRGAGIAVSLYGVRSARNWGCGDFTDLEALIDWAVDEAGVSFIALNPLHAIANRAPYNTSPYLPASIFYRNYLYLDVERVEDFHQSPWSARLLANPATQAEIAGLRASELVEYERVAAMKLRCLRLAFRVFLDEYRRDTLRARQFREYTWREGEPLDRFAIYSALEEWIHRLQHDTWIWPDWPEEYRRPDSPAVRAFVREHWRLVLFHKYLQWQVDLQLDRAKQRAEHKGMSIGLYHDLALATDRCGSDLWAYREFFASGCRVGSPPDSFSPEGQDWAFPPPNSERHRQDGYRLFRETLRKNARHGGALRIDHVMRFFRLFWIPDGLKASQGAYVSELHEDWMRIVALESVRGRFVVVGEDLGTVEPAIRQELERFGVLSYKLLYFEREEGGAFRKPEQYATQAVVSSTTHDLATLAGFWLGRDIESRRAVGLAEESYRRQIEDRARDKQQLLDTLFALGLLPEGFPRSAAQMRELNGELHNAIVGFLASTPSALLVINQEDLTKETEQQNLPGSTAEYPNWRRKMRFSLEQLTADKRARDFAAMLRHWLERTGRSAGPPTSYVPLTAGRNQYPGRPD